MLKMNMIITLFSKGFQTYISLLEEFQKTKKTLIYLKMEVYNHIDTKS